MNDLTDILPIAAFLPATVIPDSRMSDEKLEVSAAIALDGERIRCERNEKRELRIYAPTPETVWFMIERFGRALRLWARRKEFDGTVFVRRRFFLANESVMCPDIAFVTKKADQPTIDRHRGQPLKIRPNFVAEFCSHPDELRGLKAKMLHWMANGSKLGWLITPQEQRIYVYTSSTEPSIMEEHAVEKGSLEEFVLVLSELWGLDDL